MNIFKTLRSKVLAFRNDEKGSIAVETMLMVPIIAWAMLGTLTFFDAYRNEAITFKAGLTVADMLSREAAAIDDDYIDGARELLRFLASDDPDPDLRVSVFLWDEDSSKYETVWSKARGPHSPLTSSDLTGMTDILPNMSDDERAILVETWTQYTPPWEVGLGGYSMQTYNVVSPRFVSQLCFSNTPETLSSLEC